MRFIDGGGLTWSLVDDSLNDEVEVSATAGGASAPTGAIMDFAGTVVPSGWLECNGTAYGRTGGDPSPQVALFAAIGTTWGPGDGSTTFNLPNFARRTRVGRGGAGTGTLGNVVGNVGGAETHALTVAELASHNHGDSGHIHNSVDVIWMQLGSGIPGTSRPLFEIKDSGNPANFLTGLGYANITPNGGNAAHNNVQPSAIVMMIIKT